MNDAKAETLANVFTAANFILYLMEKNVLPLFNVFVPEIEKYNDLSISLLYQHVFK